MSEQIEAVQRMQDYIEANLQGDITLASLSAVSLYSPWYSYRIFTKMVNLTPANYIRRLRLSKSAIKLQNKNVKILDVAFELGFKSVDGYQRAFFREFGCNPHEYSLNPIPIYLFKPYGVKYKKPKGERTMCKTKNVFIQVVEKPARKVIIKRGVKATDYFSYCDEVGCDIWGLLTSIKSISNEPVCLWLPDKYIKPKTSQYVQGVEVPCNYDSVVPEGLDVIELPASKFLMFHGEPFEEEDYCNAIEEIWSAIDKYDPSIVGLSWDKENPKIQLEPIGTRGYIELVPVK